MSDLRKAAQAQPDQPPTGFWEKTDREVCSDLVRAAADGPTRKDKQTAPSPTTSDRGLPQAVGWLGRLWNGGPKCEVYTADQMLAFRAAGVAQERERCAKVCDDLAANDKLSNYYAVAARAIRKG